MLRIYSLTVSKPSNDNLEPAMGGLEGNFMDKKTDENVRTIVIDFGKLAKSKEKPIAGLSSEEKKYMKERLGSLLEKNMAGASSAIQSATASATSSLLPTENAIKGLLEVQDRFKKINSPWNDMVSKFSGRELHHFTVPKGFSGTDSLFNLVKRFESPLEKMKLQNFGEDSAVKSITASTVGQGNFSLGQKQEAQFPWERELFQKIRHGYFDVSEAKEFWQCSLRTALRRIDTLKKSGRVLVSGQTRSRRFKFKP